MVRCWRVFIFFGHPISGMTRTIGFFTNNFDEVWFRVACDGKGRPKIQNGNPNQQPKAIHLPYRSRYEPAKGENVITRNVFASNYLANCCCKKITEDN